MTIGNRLVAYPIALAAMLAAGPVSASTLPRVDFAQGQVMVSAGVLDVDLDVALLDQWSLGLSLMPLPSGNDWYDPILSPLSAAARTTYRAGTFGGVSVGATLSAGVFAPLIVGGMRPSLNPFPGLPLLKYQYRAFVQPAVNIAWPLGQDEGHWTLRATVGPVFIVDGPDPQVIPLWPNLEFAKALGAHSELTLLGNGLVGWRGVF